jgi:hypothetical protein
MFIMSLVPLSHVLSKYYRIDRNITRVENRLRHYWFFCQRVRLTSRRIYSYPIKSYLQFLIHSGSTQWLSCTSNMRMHLSSDYLSGSMVILVWSHSLVINVWNLTKQSGSNLTSCILRVWTLYCWGWIEFARLKVVSRTMMHQSKWVINTYTHLHRLLITRLTVGIFRSRYSGLTLGLTSLPE